MGCPSIGEALLALYLHSALDSAEYDSERNRCGTSSNYKSTFRAEMPPRLGHLAASPFVGKVISLTWRTIGGDTSPSHLQARSHAGPALFQRPCAAQGGCPTTALLSLLTGT